MVKNFNIISPLASRSLSTVGKRVGGIIAPYVANAITGNIDFARQKELIRNAQNFSASEAQKLRDWQEQMSNTAYSRAIADLRSNGLNPYAVGSFGAASTPSGAMGQGFSASANQVSRNILAVGQLALSAYRTYEKTLTDLLGVFL